MSVLGGYDECKKCEELEAQLQEARGLLERVAKGPWETVDGHENPICHFCGMELQAYGVPEHEPECVYVAIRAFLGESS